RGARPVPPFVGAASAANANDAPAPLQESRPRPTQERPAFGQPTQGGLGSMSGPSPVVAAEAAPDRRLGPDPQPRPVRRIQALRHPGGLTGDRVSTGAAVRAGR